MLYNVTKICKTTYTLMSLIDVIVVENKVMTIKVSKSYKYNKLMAYIAMLSNVANKIKCVQVDVKEHINKKIYVQICVFLGLLK